MPALLTIVAAVHLLLQYTAREQLLPAIIQLIRPATTQQIRERFAVRMLLSIEAVTQMHSLASDILCKHPVNSRKFSSLASSSRLLYRRVLDRAEQAGQAPIEVNELESPPWWQWVIPIAMMAVIFITV